jgi:hypothetical protein
MPRKALAIDPTYETIEPGRDAYLHTTQMRATAKKFGRYWAFHDVPTTVALPDSRFAKSLNSFADHSDESAFRELLKEYAYHNCPRPSGYADVFHEKFKSPRVSWSINSQFAPCLAGGWQETLSPGVHFGVFRKYDMRSAYLWAATLGLPDTRTYTRSLNYWKGGYDGLFRIKLLEPCKGAPFPFNQARECIATNLEIETYGLRVGEVVDGVIWKRMIDPQPIISAVLETSTWKQAGRSYWGRWAQMQRVQCVSHSREWTLPNTTLNIPWAHLIVSRVKMRLWNYSRKAVHVYVDSVITPDELPVGTSVGDWRLEKTYANGVIVRNPGQYGNIEARTMERMAGVSKDSLLRNNPVAVA